MDATRTQQLEEEVAFLRARNEDLTRVVSELLEQRDELFGRISAVSAIVDPDREVIEPTPNPVTGETRTLRAWRENPVTGEPELVPRHG